jgi:ceramide glucosyltransferase
MVTILLLLIATSLGICFAQLAFARASVRKATRGKADGAFAPLVTILKPLRGIEDGLFDNLESFCRLDYPRYEILFCLQSPDDPALRIARKVKERHPEIDISLVVESGRAGFNPKVNNLIPGYARAKHPYVLISDSNVAATPGYLREAVSHFRNPEVGLVAHLVRGVEGRTIGAKLENSHLNTFILGSMCLLNEAFGIPCVVGKSMLFRREELDALGGLHAVKDFLAEDFTIGRLYRAAGKRVVISGATVDNVNTFRGIREFLSRHARWNRMRLSIAGPLYLLEILPNPVFLSLVLLAATAGSRVGWSVAAAATSCKIALDVSIQRILGLRIGWMQALYGPARDLFAVGLWFSSFFLRTVTWRGRTLRITRGSRLVAAGESPPWGDTDEPREAMA